MSAAETIRDRYAPARKFLAEQTAAHAATLASARATRVRTVISTAQAAEARGDWKAVYTTLSEGL